jgi:hypothetical protein
MRTTKSPMPEMRPETDSLASRTQVTHTAAELRWRRWPSWKLVVVVLGFATLFALEVLFLRFGPSIPVSAYAIVIVILGLLVLVALVSELLSWLLFAKSLAHLLGRDKGDRKRLP